MKRPKTFLRYLPEMGLLGTKHKATARTYIFCTSYRLHHAVSACSVDRNASAKRPALQSNSTTFDRSSIEHPLHSLRTCRAKGKTHRNASYSSRGVANASVAGRGGRSHRDADRGVQLGRLGHRRHREGNDAKE